MLFNLVVVCIELRNIWENVWESHSCESYNEKQRIGSRKENELSVKTMRAIVSWKWIKVHITILCPLLEDQLKNAEQEECKQKSKEDKEGRVSRGGSMVDFY